MKKLAVALSILAVLVLGLTLWGYTGARLDVQVINVRELEAGDYQERFVRLKEQLGMKAVRGLVYEDSVLGAAQDYKILEYTLKANNKGLVDAVMLEALIVPLKGDVLCYSQQEALGQDVNTPLTARSRGSLQFKVYLLTVRDAHAVRDLQVSYYVWGNPFILKVRYG